VNRGRPSATPRSTAREQRTARFALAGVLALAAGWAQAQAQATQPGSGAVTPRPSIGLVLGGGGARGAAHIGVLEVLERLRVPVDCVAGTSMGALMAGAWAAGRSPAQMREAMAGADWDDMFQDNPDYRELDFRNKRLSQRYLPGSETGITDQGAVGPPGVVLGQKIKLFFNRLVRADLAEPAIDELPIPLSLIATDIGTGERVVYREGSLTQAMRASMSVPGLIAPVSYGGRKLVDGGLVDNLPVREVRERCNADVVIAVDVGSPPLPPEQVNGVLSVTAQMVSLLSNQNVVASIAMLRPQDVFIQPELGPITSADFSRHAEAAERGRLAAEAAAPRLAALGLGPEAYAEWQRSVAVKTLALPRIDEVEVVGLKRAGVDLVRRHLVQQTGQPLDTSLLTRDLMRVYGDGYYEQVDYSVQRLAGRNVLRVMPIEKSWGPDYLRLGLQLDSNQAQGSSYQLRAGYQKTWLNTLGGELLASAEMGNRTGIGIEWYQPLTADQRWFADVAAGYGQSRADYFLGERRIAEYRELRGSLELSVGLNLRELGQWRSGWRQVQTENRLKTGVDIFSSITDRGAGGWYTSIDIDQLDRLYFARDGWAVQASWFHAVHGDYSRAQLQLRGARPFGDYVIGARASWTGSPRGELPLHDAARLGGFQNLTAYANGQLIGDEVAYAHLRVERIIGRPPLGLRGDMRFGIALEAGKVADPYTLQRHTGWLPSVAVYLGGETPIGPAYIGLGRGRSGATNAYLFIGTP
jgi:NTE family protein